MEAKVTCFSIISWNFRAPIFVGYPTRILENRRILNFPIKYEFNMYIRVFSYIRVGYPTNILTRNFILSSDFYEYNLRPTFLTFKDHFLSYHIIFI